MARAALGFSVHTGWAALVAVGPATTLLDRRRITMMGDDPELPRFVYHAIKDRPLAVAERAVRDSRKRALANARAAIEAAVAALSDAGASVVAAGVIAANQPAEEPLARIVESHSLIHSAEGELFRAAIRDGCAALHIPTVDVRARDLAERAAQVLGVDVDAHLTAIGRAAGRPWAKDQKDACLVAGMALAARATSRGSR